MRGRIRQTKKSDQKGKGRVARERGKEIGRQMEREETGDFAGNEIALVSRREELGEKKELSLKLRRSSKEKREGGDRSEFPCWQQILASVLSTHNGSHSRRKGRGLPAKPVGE